MSTTNDQVYLLDHKWEFERRRLQLLESLHDPATVRRLQQLGVEPGWRCLEVGAGHGSIARWLGRQVGPDGSVLAIDLETDLLDHLDEPNVDVWPGDLLEIDLPAGSFDLIHTRAVLTHLDDPGPAVQRMASWLAPGGWLVLEELDWFGPTGADDGWSELMHGFGQAMPTANWECGRALIGTLAAHGLESVDAGAHLDVIHGGTPLAQWYELSVRAVRELAESAGTLSAAEIDRNLRRLQDPAFRAPGFVWVGAWGRRRAG